MFYGWVQIVDWYKIGFGRHCISPQSERIHVWYNKYSSVVSHNLPAVRLYNWTMKVDNQRCAITSVACWSRPRDNPCVSITTNSRYKLRSINTVAQYSPLLGTHQENMGGCKECCVISLYTTFFGILCLLFFIQLEIQI